jgi:hypothetical protein
VSTMAGFMHMLHSDGYSLCASIEAGQWPLHALPEETATNVSGVTCPGCAEMLARDAEKRLRGCQHTNTQIHPVGRQCSGCGIRMRWDWDRNDWVPAT